MDTLMADFDERIQTLSDFADGKTAIIGMCTSGSFNVLGNDGRCSIIGVEIGFENVGVDADVDTSTHGNEASFEYIVDKNPDYIFVMDRDAAIERTARSLLRISWRTNWFRVPMHIRTAILCTWSIRPCGIPQRVESRHWI